MKQRITSPGWWLVLSILVATLQLTSGYYDPAAQRWINRDPVVDLGLQALLRAAVNEAAWAPIEEATRPHELPTFVHHNPVNRIDFVGLASANCANAAPLKDDSPACDQYGSSIYPGLGVGLRCFCKCAGNSTWAQKVRGCLACEHAKGTDVTTAHARCYTAAGSGAPYCKLLQCYIQCGGVLPGPPDGGFPGHGFP